MAVNAEDLKCRFPESFADADDEVIERSIAEAIELIPSESVLGSKYEIALRYMAAHLAVMGKTGGNAGVASAKAGSVSISFASGDAAKRSRFLDMYDACVATIPAGLFAVSRF